MPGPLKNHNHELYCQFRHAGRTQKDAYIAAGYSPNGADTSASRIERRPDVAARLAELAERQIKSVEITVEKVLNDLEDTRNKAIDAGQLAVAAKCSELQGKYQKMFTDRVEHFHLIADIPQEQLLDILKEAWSKLDASIIAAITGNAAGASASPLLEGTGGEERSGTAPDAVPG